ncbi:MAG TPA: hypothetical protein VGN17_17065 [Bryobacteraceae bacterium]|jgi:hypothetical protein
MPKKTQRSLAAEIRATLIPNPVLSLLIVGVMLIVVAVFAYGEHGGRPSPMISDVLRTVGIGAIAAAVTGIIDHNLLFKNFESRIRESLQEARDMAEGLRRLGVQNTYKPFFFSQIFAEAQKGESVRWLDTYCPLQNEFLSEVEAALARKVSIRMLVIQPNCANAKNRSLELADTPDTGKAFDASLRAFITKMESLADKSGGRFQIRFYEDLPCVPMYLIDKNNHTRKGFFSIFLSDATAHCTHMELSDGEWLQNMASYFDAKWERWDPGTGTDAQEI